MYYICSRIYTHHVVEILILAVCVCLSSVNIFHSINILLSDRLESKVNSMIYSTYACSCPGMFRELHGNMISINNNIYIKPRYMYYRRIKHIVCGPLRVIFVPLDYFITRADVIEHAIFNTACQLNIMIQRAGRHS